MKGRLTRRALDSWFPTIAKYCGLGLLVYGLVFDKGRLFLENPALVPAVAGLIFLKTALNGGKDS